MFTYLKRAFCFVCCTFKGWVMQRIFCRDTFRDASVPVLVSIYYCSPFTLTLNTVYWWKGVVWEQEQKGKPLICALLTW